MSDNGIDLPAATGESGFAGTLSRHGHATGLIGKAHFTTSHTFSPTGTPECRESSAQYGADWEGPSRDAMVAMRRIQDELAKRGVPDTNTARAATFHCMLALAWPDEHLELFHGTCDGSIVWPPRGSGGHGYDPCFQPDGDTRTTAQMSDAEKNAISHRGHAFKMMVEACFR